MWESAACKRKSTWEHLKANKTEINFVKVKSSEGISKMPVYAREFSSFVKSGLTHFGWELLRFEYTRMRGSLCECLLHNFCPFHRSCSGPGFQTFIGTKLMPSMCAENLLVGNLLTFFIWSLRTSRSLLLGMRSCVGSHDLILCFFNLCLI